MNMCALVVENVALSKKKEEKKKGKRRVGKEGGG